MTGVEIHSPSGMYRGAAWLSSARVVRCWVKSRNEAQTPTSCCYQVMLGTLEELPVTNRRKVGMTSSQHGPYVQGYTRATMAGYNEQRYREVERISKNRSQFGSESATRLREVGIASNRGSARHGEYVPGPCTHRPSHHLSLAAPEVADLTRKGGRLLR